MAEDKRPKDLNEALEKVHGPPHIPEAERERDHLTPAPTVDQALAAIRPDDGSKKPRAPFADAPETQDLFLQHLMATGKPSMSAILAGVHPSTVRKYRKKDPEFDSRVREMMTVYAETLRNEAVRRGYVGTLKPIYQQGRLVGYQREYSDKLLLRELDKVDPLPRAPAVEVTAPGGAIVVGTPTQSVSDWLKKYGDQAEDAEFEEIPSDAASADPAPDA